MSSFEFTTIAYILQQNNYKHANQTKIIRKLDSMNSINSDK